MDSWIMNDLRSNGIAFFRTLKNVKWPGLTWVKLFSQTDFSYKSKYGIFIMSEKQYFINLLHYCKSIFLRKQMVYFMKIFNSYLCYLTVPSIKVVNETRPLVVWPQQPSLDILCAMSLKYVGHQFSITSCPLLLAEMRTPS